MNPISDERIEERAMILHGIDAQACTNCGRFIPSEAVADSAYFIDTEQGVAEDGEAVVLATILCPLCW